MKKEYKSIPPSMEKMETYGFSWMDFVTAIPSPLFVVTSYKSNGKPNACLQSWACFSGTDDGFYAILSNVNKRGHMYKSVRETSAAVLNFPSADVYDRCSDTIDNNGFDVDEITASGLTLETATTVNAPRIGDCFLSLESILLWERDITEGGSHAVMCFEITNVCIDESRMDEKYGDSGYLYNVHYPVNPEKFTGKSHDYIAVLAKLRDMGEY
jgi:Conserved protein/domain typically associated with flavoprotein oxygenases, DIM6/NTAB family